MPESADLTLAHRWTLLPAWSSYAMSYQNGAGIFAAPDFVRFD
jgi:hypothetical protein